MLGGTSALANDSATAVSRCVASSSSRTSRRVSLVRPDGPGAAPRLDFRRLWTIVWAGNWIGWSGWKLLTSGLRGWYGSGGLRAGSRSSSKVPCVPGAVGPAVNACLAADNSPICTRWRARCALRCRSGPVGAGAGLPSSGAGVLSWSKVSHSPAWNCSMRRRQSGLGKRRWPGLRWRSRRAGLGAVVGRRHAIPGCCAGHVAMPLQRLGSVCPPLRGARGHKANCWWGPGGCAGAALGCAIVLLLTSLAAALRCCCPVRLQVCWLVGTGGCSCCWCKPIRGGGQVRAFWGRGGGRTAVQAHVAKAGAVGSPWCCTGDKSIPVSIGLSRSESVAPIACAVQRFPAMLVPRQHGRGQSKGADCNTVGECPVVVLVPHWFRWGCACDWLGRCACDWLGLGSTRHVWHKGLGTGLRRRGSRADGMKGKSGDGCVLGDWQRR